MTPRQIIESKAYKAELAALRISARRMDEALEAVMILMEAHPPFFPAIPDTGGVVIRRARLADFPGLVPASIFYKETSEQFTLLRIEVVDED